MKVSYEVYYDDTTNEVSVIETSSATWQGKEPDYEIVEEESGFLSIHNYDGESMTFRKETQTKEQLAILFATVLGLREAAKEEG